MKFKAPGLASFAVVMHVLPASAHHSFAMFDAARQVTLQGTVKEFQWTSPHAWILLTVERGGRPEEWAIEMNGPSGLVRQGWQPKMLTPGCASRRSSIRFVTEPMAANSWRLRFPMGR